MNPYFVVLQCGSLTKSHVDTLFSSFYLIRYRVTSNHFILHFLVMKENMRVMVCQNLSHYYLTLSYDLSFRMYFWFLCLDQTMPFRNENSFWKKVTQKIIGIHEKKIDFFYTASARYEIETPQSCNFESFLRIPSSVRKFPKKYFLSNYIHFIDFCITFSFRSRHKKYPLYLSISTCITLDNW